MKRDKLKTNVLFSKLFIILALFLFAIIIVRTSQLALSTTIDGMNIKVFSSNLKTTEKTLKASRGSIYDANNNLLAQNVSSYTVIAYLDEDIDDENYVQDKEDTATKLAPLINMTKEAILELLNKDLYQVELGPGGRNLSQSVKEQIDALKLPGIDYIQSTKRYYPNGKYASYIIGYSKLNSKKVEDGEMGIEKYFNSYLTGSDGYSKYQSDLLGVKIANTKEIVKKAKDGNDIYLTLDTNIQLFVEQAAKTIFETAAPEWATIVVADAKTGAILGTSSYPSFDPNVRDITNYLNPLTSITYEPGSTMKIFTYLAALETGNYKGDTTYQSGSLVIADKVVKDWNNYGWGTISYDQGFALSSNVGVSTMLERGVITKKILKDYLNKLGFGSKTGITLPSEAAGKLNFKYAIETANATFGQGITTTAIQNVQALTAISNNGILLSPYIVEKIVDGDGNVVYQGGKNELGRVASETTVTKLKSLMKSVVAGTPYNCTGYKYNIPQYDLIGKTGTAQISDNVHGGYLTGYNDYIRAFSGVFPASDPQVIVYAAVKKGSNIVTLLPTQVKTLVESVGKYLNINQDQTNSVANVSYEMPSYINKNITDATKDLKSHNIYPIIIGSGTKVINQYPAKGSTVTYLDKVILLTNSTEIKMPNLIGWSKKDFITLAKLLGLKYEIEGTGYINSQSIATNTIIKNTDILKVTLIEVAIQ